MLIFFTDLKFIFWYPILFKEMLELTRIVAVGRILDLVSWASHFLVDQQLQSKHLFIREGWLGGCGTFETKIKSKEPN